MNDTNKSQEAELTASPNYGNTNDDRVKAILEVGSSLAHEKIAVVRLVELGNPM